MEKKRVWLCPTDHLIQVTGAFYRLDCFELLEIMPLEVNHQSYVAVVFTGSYPFVELELKRIIPGLILDHIQSPGQL